MKVDHPKFDSVSPVNTVQCYECPFADEDGFCDPDTALYRLCNSWGRDHCPSCPTAENYTEACEAAETAMLKARAAGGGENG